MSVCETMCKLNIDREGMSVVQPSGRFRNHTTVLEASEFCLCYAYHNPCADTVRVAIIEQKDDGSWARNVSYVDKKYFNLGDWE